MNAGDRLTVTIEKPAAGGRMIARHEGRVILVDGAIPGEVAEIVVERVQRGTVWASVARLVEPSPDRVEAGDGACGGNVYAHVRYPRQLALKREIIRDAFHRIARLELPGSFDVFESPARGYRMRARLHVRGGRVGFFREGTHELCPAPPTGQLSSGACEVVERLEQALRKAPEARVTEIELSENVPGDQRVCHFELGPGADPSRLGSTIDVPDVQGLTCAVGADARELVLRGDPRVSDMLDVVLSSGGAASVQLVRHARSFFQGNRFLLGALVNYVNALVPDGPMLDLYAGVGLFSVTRAARGGVQVTAVEGDRWAAADLKLNARAQGDAVAVRRAPVEGLPRSLPRSGETTIVVDPPRTGLSREAAHLIAGWRAVRVIYVSCDVATLARDVRLLVDAGYGIASVAAFDLFPNTAHVETVLGLERAEASK